MNKHIAVVGASIGGLVAAAELRSKGFDVTLIEKGKAVAGLYGKVDTPFGKQELGMHVLYLTEQHYKHLCAIFGSDVFQVWSGYRVDIGSAYNFNKNSFNSIYPDVRELPEQKEILAQIMCGGSDAYNPGNALEAVNARFGRIAGEKVFAPILKKLWKTEPAQLSSDAIHCFYDLRRVVVCDKQEADSLKQDNWLDKVIANPDQSQPSGVVFNGRMAARFKNTCGDLSEIVMNWLKEQNIRVCFNSSIMITDNKVMFNGVPINEQFDACIIASPLAAIVPNSQNSMDLLELSIYYFKLAKNITDEFPAYYMLCHDAETLSSRIVNYDAYGIENSDDHSVVISVEVTHDIGNAPLIQDVEVELKRILPFASIVDSYTLPTTLRVPIPSLKNAALLDKYTELLTLSNPQQPIFFSGMRTDKGVFFSHHTIGLAYDSAVECSARLS
ncbi:NAD(P)-binding protein [Methylomonas sp. SURF-2]|uniref:NAD(P)-binding protein n=1 Tax=Methylomonas subterranea TaxID=2952225 RepID=A0ABT1TC88_9GAMM|nr:NAD(P)-binding protein [Methylomonas sp. SURF-2]